ncbi:MAG: CvpA family protein [Alphaproteobacteria bacterium]
MEFMNWVDIALLSVLLLFAIFGFISGFTEKFFSIMGWVGAGILTTHVYPWLKPWAQHHISNETMANIITFVGIFLVLLIVFRLGTSFLSSSVKGSPLGALDRGLGMALGVLTGLLLFAALCLADRTYFHTLSKNTHFQDSRVWSFSMVASTFLEKLFPDSMVQPTTKKKHDALVHHLSLPPETKKRTKGYSKGDRQQITAIANRKSK